MDATGRCLCGAVSYTAQDVETDLHVCHCNMCRRWNGGPAFAVSVGRITFQGVEHIARYDSSQWAERGFCKQCGSNLFYRLKESDHHVVWLGSFDEQAPFQLSDEIFVDEKPASYALAGTHRRLTGEEFMASIKPDSN